MTTIIFALIWIGTTILVIGGFSWYLLKKAASHHSYFQPMFTAVVLFLSGMAMAVSTVIGVLAYVFFFIMR